jgi:subtilisin family serine protease
VRLDVPRGSELRLAQRLRAEPGVNFAEPDYVLREAGAPGDPSFGLQWALENEGQTIAGEAGTVGADESAVPAWEVETGSRSVVVAVTDSGVDYTHPDLAANIWTNPGGVGGCPAGTHGWNVIADTCDPMDDETPFGGHGTHVAGIIGAVGDNGIGVTGVNQRTTILPVKWLDSQGNGATSDLIEALQRVLEAKQAGVNVRVVNDSATFVGTAPSQALADQIDLLGANGILFVTAAGNTAEDNDDPTKRRYPCGYGLATEICVTASDQQDRLARFANYGDETVDLAAPGVNIYSTLRGGRYGFISGGSMAAPQVAGAAALILAQQNLTVGALKDAILTNVDPLPSLAGLVRTGGRLDICKALVGCGVGDPSPPGPPDPGPPPSSPPPPGPAPTEPPVPPGTDPTPADPVPPSVIKPDSTAPQTTIDTRPYRRTGQRRVLFTFSASEPKAHFQCRLDHGRYRRCRSPKELTVRPGRHTFRVRAVDAAGNRDRSAARARFTVMSCCRWIPIG